MNIALRNASSRRRTRIWIGSSKRGLVLLAPAVALASSALASAITYGPFNGNANTALGVDTSTGLYNLASVNLFRGDVAFLIPPLPLELTLGGTDSFNTTLANAGFTPANGWKFMKGASLPDNSLNVTADQVGAAFTCPPSLAGGQGPCDGIFAAANGKVQNNQVGEKQGFTVSNANPADNGHWIQTLQTNLALLPLDNGGEPGNPHTLDPYYLVADASNFLDAPGLASLPGAYYFLASLYYVNGGARAGTAENPTVVTVQNGMAWGFVDLNLGVTNPAALRAALDSDLSSVANLDASLGGGIDLSGDLTQTTLNQIDAGVDAQFAPEPGTFMLIAMGIASLSVARALKRSAR
jgi:hypothetical protein